MKINPFPQVVVLKDLGPIKSDAGLISPGVEDERLKPEVGEVVSIGSGKRPFPFQVGDVLVFEKYLRSPITLPNGDEYNFIRFDKLIARIDL